MKKTRKATAKVAARPSIAERTAVAIKQAGAHARGEHVPGLVARKPVDVKAVRAKVDMSQNEFATTFGFTLGAVRDWEQHRRTPERAAATLMRVIEIAPEIAKKAASEAV